MADGGTAMCLILGKRQRADGKIARKEIRCWKRLYREADGTLRSPWMSTVYEERKGASVTPDRKPDIHVITFLDQKARGLFGGALHAYMDTWEGLYKTVCDMGSDCCVLALMHIPKGTRYWTSDDFEIAATELVFDGVLCEGSVNGTKDVYGLYRLCGEKMGSNLKTDLYVHDVEN